MQNGMEIEKRGKGKKKKKMNGKGLYLLEKSEKLKGVGISLPQLPWTASSMATGTPQQRTLLNELTMTDYGHSTAK
jgi:hypothetical protein